MEENSFIDAQAAKENKKSINTSQKKKPFGFPLPLVQNLKNAGITEEEVKQMSFEEALEKAKKSLIGPGLQKTLLTIFKTSPFLSLLVKRFSILFGPVPEGVSTLVYIVNCATKDIDIDGYSGDAGNLDGADFIRFLFWLVVRSNSKIAKTAGLYVLPHVSVEIGELKEIITESMLLFKAPAADAEEEEVEKHLFLFGGSSVGKQKLKELLGDSASALEAVTRSRKESLFCIWPQILDLYAVAGKSSLPFEKVRELGKSVLKNIKNEEEVIQACTQYIQSMRKKAHEFWYAFWFVKVLNNFNTEKAKATLSQLLIYLFTELSICNRELCSLGLSSLDTSFLLSVLEKVHPEKMNIRTVVPVIKNMIKQSKKNMQTLQEIFRILNHVQSECKRDSSSLNDVIGNLKTIVVLDTEKQQ